MPADDDAVQREFDALRARIDAMPGSAEKRGQIATLAGMLLSYAAPLTEDVVRPFTDMLSHRELADLVLHLDNECGRRGA